MLIFAWGFAAGVVATVCTLLAAVAAVAWSIREDEHPPVVARHEKPAHLALPTP